MKKHNHERSLLRYMICNLTNCVLHWVWHYVKKHNANHPAENRLCVVTLERFLYCFLVDMNAA